jgi:hypothetical protein
MITAYNWLVGYKESEDDADDEKEEKPTEEKEDEEIPPPPPLIRQQGYYKGNNGTNDVKITWANYDEEFNKVNQELKEMRKMLDDLDIIVKKTQDTAEDLNKLDAEWKNRLSPVEDVVLLKTKKRRKRKKTNNNV